MTFLSRCSYKVRKQKLNKFQIFDQNHGLAPFEKYTFFNNFLKSMFSRSRKGIFLSTRSRNPLFWPILLKKLNKEISFIFDKTLDKSSEKIKTRCSYSLETLFSKYKFKKYFVLAYCS